MRTASHQVQRLVVGGRARTVLHLCLQGAVAVATVVWCAGRVEPVVAVAAVASALTLVVLGALAQLDKLNAFAARVRIRSGAHPARPERSDPSPETAAIVASVADALRMPRDSVHAYVGPLEADRAGGDLPLAAVLPPSRGATIVLIDDDLEAHITDAAHGGSPYGRHPDDFLVEVRSVIAHELAHVRAWDAPSRPFAVGVAQFAPRLALAAALFVSWEQDQLLGLVGAGVLAITGLLCVVAARRRVVVAARAGTSAWLAAATLAGAVPWSMALGVAVACVIPTLVMTGFERGQEYGADRIAAAVVGSGRPLARFLRRFPSGPSGARGILSSHPSITLRLGRLARIR